MTLRFDPGILVASLAGAIVVSIVAIVSGAAPFTAFAIAVPLGLALAWISSVLLNRRVSALTSAAVKFESSIRDLGQRLGDLSRDRAHMQAILSGMVEGVLVLDRQGRVQLVGNILSFVDRTNFPIRNRAAAAEFACENRAVVGVQ